MNAISQAFEALAARQAEHRKARADLAEMRQMHSRTGEQLNSLRTRFAEAAHDNAKAEKMAAKIATAERVAIEHQRLIAGHVAREREALGAVHAAERVVAGLRHRRGVIEQDLDRSAGVRAQLVHRVKQAEQAAAARRDILKQHDLTVSSLKAELASLAELEPTPEAA